MWDEKNKVESYYIRKKELMIIFIKYTAKCCYKIKMVVK